MAVSTKKSPDQSPKFLFGKINFILMIVGIIIISVGYLLMIGGYPEDPNVFNADEKYSFTRITLSPIIIFIGLAVEVVAILYKQPASN